MQGKRTSAAMRRRVVVSAAMIAVIALAVVAVNATARVHRVASTAVSAPPVQTIPTRPAVAPVMSCGQLLSQNFSTIPGAPTSLTAATLVGSGAAQYCDVTGWIAPQTQFELRLPTSTYQGRYLQTGCGGNCGTVNIGVSPTADVATALTSNTFAVSTNNEGHTSTGPWDVWGAGGASNPLRAQFGYLADHLNAVVAKAIITSFYGRGPAYSYFDGYSDGGRAAVQEAQRYPHDFSGIVAGAPAITIQDALVFFDYAAQHLLDASGNQILDTTAITTLHNAAVAACDGTDGVVDGQISDPRLCHWNPAQIECSTTLTSNCLTPQQVTAAQAMYEGPRTTDGSYMWTGGQSYGSELAWPSFAAAGVALAGSNLRFLSFAQDPPPSFTWKDLTFTKQTWQALQAMGAVYDSNNDNHPNLNAFHHAGGKLLVWQSWQDEAGGAYSVPDWYAQIIDRAGGLASAQRFARVFMLPTGSHGQAASGAIYNLQVLPSLINWTEIGQVPQKLDAWQTDSTGAVTRTYPVYALPAEAKYTGHGNVNDEANWTSYVPIANLHFRWLGDEQAAPFPYPGWPFASPGTSHARDRHPRESRGRVRRLARNRTGRRSA
jgi:tannase/feruloyl esterase